MIYRPELMPCAPAVDESAAAPVKPPPCRGGSSDYPNMKMASRVKDIKVELVRPRWHTLIDEDSCGGEEENDYDFVEEASALSTPSSTSSRTRRWSTSPCSLNPLAAVAAV